MKSNLTLKDISEFIKEYFNVKDSLPFLTKKNIKTILDYRIDRINGYDNLAGIDVIYELIGKASLKIREKLYKECFKIGIPKKYATGFIIIKLQWMKKNNLKL